MRNLLLAILATSALSACVPIVAAGVVGGGRAVSQDRSVGGAVDDLTIETTINHHFFRTDVNDLFKNIDVDVIEGRVFLTGNVKDNATMMKAVELAWEVAGVNEVINEVQVENTSSATDAARDIWIETQIEGELLITKHIRSANYNAESVNGIVTLMGIAQDATELENVTSIISRISGVKQVVSHVIMRDDPRRINPVKVGTTVKNNTSNVAPTSSSSSSGSYTIKPSTSPADETYPAEIYGSPDGSGGTQYKAPQPTDGFYD